MGDFRSVADPAAERGPERFFRDAFRTERTATFRVGGADREVAFFCFGFRCDFATPALAFRTGKIQLFDCNTFRSDCNLWRCEFTNIENEIIHSVAIGLQKT